MKKRIFLALLSACLSISLFGCGKKEEEVSYDLVAYSVDQLQNDTYYIKTDNGFYPVAKGTLAFGEQDTEIATAVSNDRMVWFGPDDAQIPTMYKNQSLVYVTSNQIPSSWTFERFEDLGYTIGVRALTENSGGRYETTIDGFTLHPLSSAYTTLGGLDTGTIIGIDQIGSTKISKDYVTRGGTITGLSKNQIYNVDIYKGTSYLQAQLAADTHAFASYELFQTTEYSYNQTYYVTIDVPDYFLSGYYYINGAGLFKYVANDASQGISGIDFNTPYYVGMDDSGNLLTKEQYQEYLNGTYVADSENTDKSDETTNSWTFTQSIDNTMEEISFLITYSDMYIAPEMEMASAQLEQTQTTNQVASAETEEKEEIVPTATLISPSGQEYEFKSDSTEGETLTCSVTMPESGEWIIKMYGMETKVFNLTSNINSGHSNSVVHSGSGTAEMTYYLPNALKDGKLEVTWENTDRAAVVEIEGPDGTKYTTNTEINSSDVQQIEIISSDYGKMTLHMGTLIAGNYTIKITGEDLGRVRYTTSEMTDSDKEALKGGNSNNDDSDSAIESDESEDDESEDNDAEDDENEEPKG